MPPALRETHLEVVVQRHDVLVAARHALEDSDLVADLRDGELVGSWQLGGSWHGTWGI